MSDEFAQTIDWMSEGTERFLYLVEELPERLFSSPSLLPGWSRAHVIGHIARNAEALTRLLNWGRTGIETPMYASATQRSSEIEQSASNSPKMLRQEVVATSRQLSDLLEEMTSSAWQQIVRTATGRLVPASVVPWLRTREVWLHSVDLDSGAEMGELPQGVRRKLIDEMVTSFATREISPPFLVVATDLTTTWQVGEAPELNLSADSTEILGWLSGRSSGQGISGAEVLPELPAWL